MGAVTLSFILTTAATILHPIQAAPTSPLTTITVISSHTSTQGTPITVATRASSTGNSVPTTGTPITVPTRASSTGNSVPTTATSPTAAQPSSILAKPTLVSAQPSSISAQSSSVSPQPSSVSAQSSSVSAQPSSVSSQPSSISSQSSSVSVRPDSTVASTHKFETPTVSRKFPATTGEITIGCDHCSANLSCSQNDSDCENKTACDPHTGICHGGCEEGWAGQKCDINAALTNGTSPVTAVTDGGSGLDPMKTAVIVLSLLFVASLAINIFILFRRVRMKFRKPEGKRSFHVAKYRPDDDGQVDLTNSKTVSSMEYQPTHTGILSGLPGEEYEDLYPGPTHAPLTRNYKPQTRVPPPASAKIERPRSTSSNSSSADRGKSQSVESSLDPARGSFDTIGEENHTDYKLRAPSAPEVRERESETTRVISAGAPKRPKRRSDVKRHMPSADETLHASSGSTESLKSGVQMREPLSRESLADHKRVEPGGIQKRSSGSYAIPDDDTQHTESDVKKDLPEEVDDGLYENEEFLDMKVDVNKSVRDDEDDSDPYENDDFIEQNFRRRADKNRFEQHPEERPQESMDVDRSTENQEDDSDPYENDDFIEQNFRRRANKRFQEQNDTVDSRIVSQEGNSDRDENGDIIERKFQPRFAWEFDQGAPSDEVPNSHVENSGVITPPGYTFDSFYQTRLDYSIGDHFSSECPDYPPPPPPSDVNEEPSESPMGVSDVAGVLTGDNFNNQGTGNLDGEHASFRTQFIQEYQSSEHLDVMGEEEDEEIVQLHLSGHDNEKDDRENVDSQRRQGYQEFSVNRRTAQKGNTYYERNQENDAWETYHDDTGAVDDDSRVDKSYQKMNSVTQHYTAEEEEGHEPNIPQTPTDKWEDFNSNKTQRPSLSLRTSEANASNTISDTRIPWTSEPYQSPMVEAWPESPAGDMSSGGFEDGGFNPQRRDKTKLPPLSRFRWSVSDTGSEGGQNGGEDLDVWSRAMETHLGHESEETESYPSGDEFDV